MKTSLLAFALMGLAAASGCSSEDSAGDPGASDVVNVTISSNQFSPAQVKIKVGQTVRWTWAGGSHNVVSGPDCDAHDGNFRSGAPQSGGTFDKRFEKAGTFPYYCELHCSMGMKGEVIVE
jgi:plastocyanin